MKKLFLLFAALTCCFAMKAQSVTYEPIMSIPSPINSDAVYYLGYQDGDDYYLHTSGTTTGQMQLSKNPENPVEYRFSNITGGVGAYLIGGDNLYLSIDTEGVAHKTFNPFSQTPFSLSIVNGDISSAAASGYTVCHDGNIITTHTGTEGNLRFFVKPSQPSYNINVSVSPEGTGSATATIGGEQVESADEGTQITVTATRNTGYKFIYWTENDKVVSYNNPYTFTLTTDRNLVANFSKQYDFSATCTTGQTLYYRIIDAEKHWVSIVAPNNETWDYAWYGFTKPTGNITLPETVTHNDISYTVKEIGICAFSLCDGLTGSLSIPNSVTSIGEQAFDRCSGFTGSLTIGNSVTSIGISAFRNCYGFTGSLTIGSSVTSIGDFAFNGCSGFTGSLIIGNSVTNIGENAFELCSNFTGSLNIPNSVTSIGGLAFYGCSGFTGSLTIGNSVTSIGQSAFQDCSGFTGLLTIGNSVTSIGGRAFYGCSGFTGDLNIPNSVAIIGGYAFYGCYGFTGSLTIGSSVTSIGEYAFFKRSFSKIILKPATPPTLGNNAFLYMSNLETITVPCGNYAEYYLATSWFSFNDKLVEGFVYDLTVASANNGFGSASITQQPDCSTQAKVTATPNDGYKFVNWTENGEVVSYNNPYIFEMTTDRNLVANFVENEIKITANQDPDHKQNYYATFYSSAADYQVPSDVTAYTGKVEDSTSEPNTSVLKLAAIEDNIIPDSQGVILKLTTNDNTETQKQFVITLTTEAGTWSGTNALTGTDEEKTLGANDYALSLGQNGVGFYLWKDKSIDAHKAYLTLESPTMAKAFTFMFDDGETTAIEQPAINGKQSGDTYNLNGVRVNDNYKGIVIKNGKKIYQK